MGTVQKSKTAWDVKRGNIDRGYGHLTDSELIDWAIHQSELTEAYHAGQIQSTSATAGGRIRKQKMLDRVNQALTTRSNFPQNEIVARLVEVDKHLKDPGLLENFEYFDVPSSDFMLGFYFAVWDRRIAELMDFLHNYGKDLRGNIRKVPQDDVWYHMSYFEGMNIDKRKQAKDVVDFIKFHHITQATSFGGGNIPERFYGLPQDLRLTVFDDGTVSPLSKLFPDKSQRRNVSYIHSPLSVAPKHQELLGTQQLVWMHGVSMYLDEEHYEMAGAILCAAALLQPGGFMRYDYLIANDSMHRCLTTQCWPYVPGRSMTIFEDPAAAIEQGQRTLSVANAKLGGKAFMDIVDINVNQYDPWGPISVYFTVQKHA